jgi:hypothetical protein
MKLAFRRGAPLNATLWQKFTCWVIKARLVSQYCHGGVVIDGSLYHATAKRGLHVLGPTEWSPKNWDIFEVGGDDALALKNFAQFKGAKYDWFSLLAFVGLYARDSRRFYCFDWQFFAKTGKMAKNRVTPESLISGSFLYVNGK